TYFVGSRDWGFSVWAHNAEYVLVRYRDGYRLAEKVTDNSYRLVRDIHNQPRFFASDVEARAAVTPGGGTIVAGPRTAPPEAIENALRGYQSQRYIIGQNTYQLDRAGMTHILEGHHPNYFNGEYQTIQSF